MLGSILDVAIALVSVYVFFSLVVSALNEIWLSFLDKRADFLAEGLAELLQDPKRKEINHWNFLQKKKPSPAVADLCRHGLINALSRAKTTVPSYIPAGAFASALLDFIKPADPAIDRTLDDLRGGIEKIQNEPLKQSLTAILDASKNDIDKFRNGIREWFDQSMDRVSGWYKRYTQMWLLFLALLLAVGTNVDTAHIVRQLSIDPKLRAALVADATAYVQKSDQAEMPHLPDDVIAPMPTPDAAPEQAEVRAASPDLLLKKSQTAITVLNELQLPVGWDAAQREYLYDGGHRKLHWGHAVTAFFGWFITALAASMGAPFWFDTLRRFINIRAAGRAPDEKDLPIMRSATDARA